MAGDNADVASVDTTDVLAADNADVLAAATTDVLAAYRYLASEASLYHTRSCFCCLLFGVLLSLFVCLGLLSGSESL